MFSSNKSDCELAEASRQVEELECSYLSDVELVSASQNGGFFEGFRWEWNIILAAA